MEYNKYGMSEDELETKLDRLTELSGELGLFVPAARYSITSISPSGEVVDQRDGISRSWVRNAYNYIAGMMTCNPLVTAAFGAGYLSMKAVAGTMLTAAVPGFYLYSAGVVYNYELNTGYAAFVDVSTRGIVVGSGGIAESFNDYKLASGILSGTTTGKLSYQVCSYPSGTYNAGTREYTITWQRYLNNNSGAQVNVSEIGIYAYVTFLGIPTMFCRDVVTPAIVVTDAGQLLVDYAITLTYPA